MKRNTKLALSTAIFAGLVIGGSALSLNRSATLRTHAVAANPTSVVRRSVIKVHTERGVVTLPGTVGTWADAEHAVFIADSVADFQMANSEIPAGFPTSD